MPSTLRLSLSGGLLCTVGLLLAGPAPAQPAGSPPAGPAQHNLAEAADAQARADQSTNPAQLLKVPLVHNIPGNIKVGGNIQNPMAKDPQSVQRGMKYFDSFNCAGCHAPNGGGGMGVSLSNSAFKFGSDPAAIFLVISHGAPLGMPAWGSLLPDNVIWDLVSYIKSISDAPSTSWGTTVSLEAGLPKIEQVPAEFRETATPWQYTEPFSNGQKPSDRNPTSDFQLPAPGQK